MGDMPATVSEGIKPGTLHTTDIYWTVKPSYFIQCYETEVGYTNKRTHDGE